MGQSSYEIGFYVLGNCIGIANKAKKSYRWEAVAVLEAAGVEPASCSEVA
jgi:hypothetical protein